MARALPWIGALLGASAYLAGVLARWPWFNGSPYWTWPWRNEPLTPVLALCALPLGLVALSLRDRGPRPRVGRALALLGVAHALLQWTAFLGTDSLGFLDAVVRDADATSYDTDAARIDDPRAFLATYHATTLAFHTTTKPPGPVLLYWAARRVCGSSAGPVAGAVAISLLSMAGPAACYAYARLLAPRRRPALVAAALYAVAPGPVLFLPELDQLYAALAVAMLVSWRYAYRRGRPAAAIGLGLVMAGAFAFAYNLLPLGALMAAGAARQALEKPARRAARVARAALLAVATTVAVAATVHLATGYRPIAAFARAVGEQARHETGYDRPYAQCVLFDPLDFLRGAGFASVALVAAYLARQRGSRARTAAGGLAFVLFLDLTGLLRAETMRVWLFALPLVLAPAGVALARHRLGVVALVLVVQWLAIPVMRARMGFIGFGG